VRRHFLRENYRRRGQATGNQGEMKVRFISPDHCEVTVIRQSPTLTQNMKAKSVNPLKLSWSR
jgi:hypothetical protein